LIILGIHIAYSAFNVAKLLVYDRRMRSVYWSNQTIMFDLR